LFFVCFSFNDLVLFFVYLQMLLMLLLLFAIVFGNGWSRDSSSKAIKFLKGKVIKSRFLNF